MNKALYYPTAKECITYLEQNYTPSLWAVNIEWDTDGEDVFLPIEMMLPYWMNENTDREEISDWITEQTGYCHFGFRLKRK